MARLAITAVCVLIASIVLADKRATDTTPAEDLRLYRDYFSKRFPGISLNEFGNGTYAIDQVSRENWEAIEPPLHMLMIETGETLWNTAFVNGKTYGNCFHEGPGQRKNFPYWDNKRKMVVTLPLAINECRTSNGEQPFDYGKGRITNLLAYMSYASRGQKVDIEIPNNDALTAYNEGKHDFFARRGQLNLSCAHCHMESAGKHLRTIILSPALGHTSGWPVYRSEWGELGTLHRRFGDCNEQVGAKPFNAQSRAYRNLEYFLSHMSNGIEYNGPSARR